MFVRRKTVTGDLEAARRDGVAKAFNENVCGDSVALAHRDVKHQLTAAFDGNENLGIAHILIVLRPNALFLFADEAPDFVNFHVANNYVLDVGGHDLLALLAGEHQELQNRVAMQSDDAFRTAHAGALQEQLNGKDSPVLRDGHGAERLLVSLSVGLAAIGATEPAQAIATLPELTARRLAFGADHVRSGLFHESIIQQPLAVYKRLRFLKEAQASSPFCCWFWLFISPEQENTMPCGHSPWREDIALRANAKTGAEDPPESGGSGKWGRAHVHLTSFSISNLGGVLAKPNGVI
jgi:hypothetical protein